LGEIKKGMPKEWTGVITKGLSDYDPLVQRQGQVQIREKRSHQHHMKKRSHGLMEMGLETVGGK
jgi:hypothetical protein